MSGLLAIESSSEACSAALSINGERTTKFFHEPRKHAELLLPAIGELLSDGGIALRDLKAIAFGRGPGSFTSLRIGIGVVQGLAWGAEVGVVPVSSLAALAQGVTRQHHVSPDAVIVAAMDARMGEVFHARFKMGSSGLVEFLTDEVVVPPETVDLPVADQVFCIGNGFERYLELQQKLTDDAVVVSGQWPSAIDVMSLAEEWLADNDPLPAHQAQPVYVRDNVAKKTAEQG